jgi:hypothetical protein
LPAETEESTEPVEDGEPVSGTEPTGEGAPEEPTASDDPTGTTLTPGDPSATPSRDTDPPPTPEQISPSNGAIQGWNTGITLTWSPVDDESGVTYGVEIQRFDTDAAGFVAWKTVPGITDASLTYQTGETTERWRVWAVDGEENASAKSGWWTIGKVMMLVPVPEPETPPTIY